MNLSITGELFIQGEEALRLFAYPDPASQLARATPNFANQWGKRPASEIIAKLSPDVAHLSGSPWTCGYGETMGVTQYTQWTEQEAKLHFRRSIKKYEDAVTQAATAPTQGQFDAMVSLCYNIGIKGFLGSSVLKAHNRGDWASASRAFNLWNKAKRKVLAGLVRRRAAEANMYIQASPLSVEEHRDAPMEQFEAKDVESERPMGKSEINIAATAAGGVAGVSAVAEGARAVADVKYSVSSLGDWMIPILLIMVVGLCVYIILQRRKQRKEGWA